MTTNIRLPRSTPAEQGVTADGIEQFVQTVEERGLGLHSVMLVRHGHVIAEHWWKPYGPEKRHMMFSLSKSFTSTAIGLAVHEGLLTEDDPVISFFPDHMTPAIEQNMKHVLIRHLLSMSTGHTEDTMPHLHRAEDGDWVRAFLNVPIEKEPGTFFLYNTGATYMLSAILQKVTGHTLLEFLTPRLFDPLGIVEPTWQSCPRGVNTGGFGLAIRTEDIAKFGLLYLQQGKWNGQQLVPAAWVENATSKHVSNAHHGTLDWAEGYGYQFWRCQHGAYRGDGAFGQFCVVMPDQDAVLAITAGTNDLQGILTAAWDNLLPAMATAERARGTAGSQHPGYGASESVPGPNGVDPGIQPNPSFAGQWYQMEENPLQIERLKVTFDSNGFDYRAVIEGKEWGLRGGYTAWGPDQRIPFDTDEPSEPVAVRGGWCDASTFAMSLCFYDTPFIYGMTVVVDDEGITLTGRMNVGFGDTKEVVVRGERAL